MPGQEEEIRMSGSGRGARQWVPGRDARTEKFAAAMPCTGTGQAQAPPPDQSALHSPVALGESGQARSASRLCSFFLAL